MLQAFVKENVMNSKEFSNFYSDYVNSLNKFNLDITYKCPLECPLCSRQHVGGKEKIKRSREMTLDEFKLVLSKSKNISLCGQISDPIYHSDFKQIMELISNNPQKTFSIHTNGTRKKTHWWKQIYKLSHKNVSWIFGLDGNDQETANIYRVNTRYDEVLDAMKLGASMGVNVTWQFIVFKHNEHQIEEAKQLAAENGIVFQILKSNRWEHEDILGNNSIEKPSENMVSTTVKEIKINFVRS
jgi:MoaA/NifB/PqqE/SkfB family radical SAM enzyme